MKGIYRIRNIVNDKCYYGSSVDINGRWSKHRNELNKNIHTNKHLQNAWNKYGEENFVLEIVEEVFHKSLLRRKEQDYLDNDKLCEYNLSNNAIGFGFGKNNPNWGKPCPEKTKRTLSITNRGNKYAVGHVVSLESRRKMSAGRKDRKLKMKNLKEIKEKYKTRKFSMRKLAKMYDVSYFTIWKVLHNKIYPNRRWLEERGK